MALRRGLVTVGAAVACCALTAACTSEPAPGATSSPTPVGRDSHRISDRAPNETRLRSCRKGVSSQHGGAGSLSQSLVVLTTKRLLHSNRLPVATISDSCSSLEFCVTTGLATRSRRTTTILGVVRDGWQEDQVRLISLRRQLGVRFYRQDRAGTLRPSSRATTFSI